MKQSITKQQWEEISKEQQYVLLSSLYKDLRLGGHEELDVDISIGQLIEFLGEDLFSINNNEPNLWGVFLTDKWEEYWYKEELIDSLWEATKYKLNENN